MSVKHTLSEDKTEVTFEVSCDGCGWFGVGFTKPGTTRSFMTSGGQGTDVVYCDGTQPDGLPQRHKLSSYGSIAPGDSNTRVLRGPLDVCGIAQGTMTFTRKIEALDDTENVIAVDTSGDTGVKFAMSWAYHASSPTISYHTGNMGHAMIALVPKRGAAESPRPTCAGNERHGAFEMHFLCAPRGDFRNIPSKFRRRSKPARPADSPRDGSRRRRGRLGDIPRPAGRGDAAGASWIVRGTGRGDAAGASWIVRGTVAATRRSVPARRPTR